jgi:hypothetical protein
MDEIESQIEKLKAFSQQLILAFEVSDDSCVNTHEIIID